MATELGRRVAVAVVGIPLTLAAIAVGGWVLATLIALAAALGTHEYYRLTEAKGARPFALPGIGLAAALPLIAVVHPTPGALAPLAAALAIALVLGTLAAAVWARGPEGQPLAAVSYTLFGALYVGGTLGFVPVLRAMGDPAGAGGISLAAGGYVLFPLVVTWAGDSAAYFVGRAWGRRKLAPHASPNKTVEGALAGLAGAALAALAVTWALSLGVRPGDPWMGPALAPALGALVGAAGQVGDLAESVLKRDAGVKDSGTLLPGHGGALDRLDALFFAVPVFWALLALLGGAA